jgi:hypothetical protein
MPCIAGWCVLSRVLLTRQPGTPPMSDTCAHGPAFANTADHFVTANTVPDTVTLWLFLAVTAKASQLDSEARTVLLSHCGVTTAFDIQQV